MVLELFNFDTKIRERTPRGYGLQNTCSLPRYIPTCVMCTILDYQLQLFMLKGFDGICYGIESKVSAFHAGLNEVEIRSTRTYGYIVL